MNYQRHPPGAAPPGQPPPMLSCTQSMPSEKAAMATDIAPPKPVTMRTTTAVSDRHMEVLFKSRPDGESFFLILWLTGWTVGCVVLAGVVYVKREVFMLVFGIPFWAAWVFVGFNLGRSNVRR